MGIPEVDAAVKRGRLATLRLRSFRSFAGTSITLLTLSGLSFTIREVPFSASETRTMRLSDAVRQQLISALHASGRKAALAITGGGSGALGELLRVPGGSRLL